MARRYALLDDQWERIKDWLPERAGQPGAQDNRLFVDAVPLPGRHPLARSAGTFRRLLGGAPALQPLEPQRCMTTGL